MAQLQTDNSRGFSLSSSNLVLLTEAEPAVGRYVEQESTNPNPTYAFLVVYDDIRQALGLTPDEGADLEYKQFRVYFGLDNEEQNFKMRLFLVPVNDAGNDVFPVNSDGQQCVYDFNAPCPATCDVNSPLFYGRFIK